jgi:membrane-bound serine protease (ClpP class)
MRKKMPFLVFYLLTVLIKAYGSPQDTVNILKIDIKKEIGSTTWLYTQKGFERAVSENFDGVLIHMNTYGGEVLHADSIRSKILNSQLPVYVFIDNNAASAGALIAIACDKIYMREGATIGAATVVNQTGEEMPDKYQSYMRATMRATAEAHGQDTIINGQDTIIRWKRDPLIAEAMVDDQTVIPNLIDSGKTLTFTSKEALKYGYCEGIAGNVDEALKQALDGKNYELTVFKPTKIDDIKGFFMSSVIQGILIMLIIGGIYFELQTPGVGFPLAAAVVAAILYFAPLYIEGLAANWEILIFIIGLILLALEIFVIPGFGIAGIFGVAFMVTGLVLSMVGNVVFNFDGVETKDLGQALITVLLSLSIGFGLTIYLSSKIGAKGAFRKVALNTVLEKNEGYIGVSTAERGLIGQKGIAYTILRPSGKVKIGNAVYDAISENQNYIEKGTEIIVTRYETGQVYVEEIH